MMESVCRALGMALILGLTASGCGGGGPSLVTLTGKVTQAGKPVEGAAVMFMPTLSSKDVQPAQDTTGPDGSFTLMTGGRSGVVPGKYQVTIMKALPTPASEAFVDDPFMATMAPGAPKGKKAGSGPEQFTFEREVPLQGDVFDFELEGKTPSKP
jgi:hypothetical protein